jgi:hypothetical protein
VLVVGDGSGVVPTTPRHPLIERVALRRSVNRKWVANRLPATR